MRIIALSAAALLGSAQAATISFEEFSAGDLVTEIEAGDVRIAVNSVMKRGETRAMIFDTRSWTGNDRDLQGPFTSVSGGPDLAPGNVLIVSTNGNSQQPNDSAKGGFFEFLFDTPVVFNSFAAFDINQAEGIALELFDESGSLGTVANQFAAPDNGYEMIDFSASNVVRAVFTLDGSGAIGEISLGALTEDTTLKTPVPAAALLFGSVLLFGIHHEGSRSRRRIASLLG